MTNKELEIKGLEQCLSSPHLQGGNDDILTICIPGLGVGRGPAGDTGSGREPDLYWEVLEAQAASKLLGHLLSGTLRGQVHPIPRLFVGSGVLLGGLTLLCLTLMSLELRFSNLIFLFL